MAASLGALLEDRALEATPTEEDLNEVSKETGDDWRNLLRHLGVPEEKVDSLLEKHRSGNPVRACFEGLVFWREGNEPATWSVLLEALEKGTEKREYAREVREKIVSRLTLIKGEEPAQKLDPAITPSSQRQPAPPMRTMDKVIGDIVEMYRKGEVSVPHNPKLEDSYDNIMATFYAILSSADPDSGAISRLQRVLQERYGGDDNQGVRQIPSPKVPETANGLFKFIFGKSTPYEILLMHPAVEAVGHQELKRELQEYESKMIKFLQKSSMSCKKRQVPLPLYKDHTHMAVVMSKEQVLLSLVLEMKEYFSKYLQLEETLFEGFEEGCTVLFFSIPRVDAALLSPKVLSHSSELRMFGMTHLIVFGYFACDLEKATVDSGIFNIPATCQDELKPRISSYVQAVRDLVQHRDTGMSWFREAADDLDRTFKRVAAAKIVGRILGIIGVVLCIVGVGLLLGGITALITPVLILVGYPLLLIGNIIATGASLGDAVQKHLSLKRANRWIRQGSDLSRDLIEKHDSYHEELDRIAKLCYKSEEEIMVNVLERNEGNEEPDLNSYVTGFHSADSKSKFIVADWKNALEIGAEDTATAFVTGAVIKRVITGYDAVGSNVAKNVNRLSVQRSAVSVGLSSVLLVVDIALIAKTVHNMKIKNGTDLANKLRQAADDMEEETAIFKQLVNFANELNL